MFGSLWEAIGKSIFTDDPNPWKSFANINASALKFGVVNVAAPTFKVLPECFIVGAICGAMGATFVIVNNWMGFFRKYYITKNWMKPVETAIFSIVITTVFFWTPYIFPACTDKV